MSKKYSYKLLSKHLDRIEELVENERFYSIDAFVTQAIEILLEWEGEKPEKCLEMMKTSDLTEPQKKLLLQLWNKESYDNYVQNNQFKSENELQNILSKTKDDHLKLLNNLSAIKDFVRNLEIKKPQNALKNDGYPLLFSFYTRLFPVKIATLTLAYLLKENNTSKIKLEDLRIYACDFAEEIAAKLINHEKSNKIPRENLLSTGLPKSLLEKDIERKISMQKRFKTQFIGSVRRQKKTDQEFVDGALISLGLIYVTKEDNEEFVWLSEKGKKFCLIENPVLNNIYDLGSLSKEEGKFIFEELISELELENEFVKTGIRTIRNFSRELKITDKLDEEFLKTAKEFQRKYPDVFYKNNLNHLTTLEDEKTRKKITGWRVATMGRLAEAKIVKWDTDDSGNSVFVVN